MNQYQVPWFPPPSNLEVITVRIDVGQHINVCKVYVPPNAWYNYQVSLLMYFNVLHLWMCPHCCDYNLPDISLSSFTDTSLFSNYTYIWSKSHAHVNSPTHLKGNILDLVLINADIIQDLMVIPPPYSLASDHYTLTFSMKFGKQQTLKTSSHYVLNSYLLECFHSASVEHVWASIKQTIYNAMHLFIPKVKLKSYELQTLDTSQTIVAL